MHNKIIGDKKKWTEMTASKFRTAVNNYRGIRTVQAIVNSQYSNQKINQNQNN